MWSASWGPLSWMLWWPRGFWFRIFGYGINIHRRSTHRVYFSERYGHNRWYYIGPICWRPLRPPNRDGDTALERFVDRGPGEDAWDEFKRHRAFLQRKRIPVTEPEGDR